MASFPVVSARAWISSGAFFHRCVNFFKPLASLLVASASATTLLIAPITSMDSEVSLQGVQMSCVWPDEWKLKPREKRSDFHRACLSVGRVKRRIESSVRSKDMAAS